jgi:tetratricopeptide (TPR) repeat protein
VVVLGNASTLARELALIPDAREREVTVTYLLEVLGRISAREPLPVRLRQRALDSLALTCATALEYDLLADDPAAALARYEELLARVAAEHPESEHLYAAEIHLARHTRDRLRQPLNAAERLERLLMDLDLPLEGVALARLALGECYLAAGDTSRGRLVLTRLGRDTDFREAAGHAHYHLARLDLAEGHFATARDRFAAVALDNPAAPYANDALGLGLAVAEELQNPTGGPTLLTLYARAVYFDLTAQPDSQRVSLQRYVDQAAVHVDLEADQPLLERGRFELAGLLAAAGRREEALAQLQRVVLDHPDGRLPAAALAESGRLLADGGRFADARRQYELLLAQYPDYLFADEIRDRVRSLP